MPKVWGRGVTPFGCTPQVATSVWVGNVKDRLPLYYYTNPPNRGKTKVTSGNLPGGIWKRYMDDVHKKLWPDDKRRFPEKAGVGDPERSANVPGAGVSPTPGPGEGCWLIFCPPGGGDNDPPGGGGGGPGGGGGLEPTLPPTRTRG